MAHAQRNFFELHAKNKSTLAEQALRYIQLLYEIESEVAIWGRIYGAEYGKKKPYR